MLRPMKIRTLALAVCSVVCVLLDRPTAVQRELYRFYLDLWLIGQNEQARRGLAGEPYCLTMPMTFDEWLNSAPRHTRATPKS